MGFESVIGFGWARLLEQQEDKRIALGCIMRQYSNQEWTFTNEMVSKTLVIRIDIDEITGKRRDAFI
jgi:nitroimidazol reductase NimA-like FMN-containing flavoprotein (pyridoxamine 5'-phosphate oxidase superfamily)